MPRPMLFRPQTQERAEPMLSTRRPEQKQQNRQMEKMQLDRLLRKNRSKEYMDAMHRLDAGGHVQNRKQVEDILQAIRAEFPELELADLLLGYVSICYLGTPYEVHTLDMSGQIIEHYKAGQLLPNGLEKARGLALRGGYDFIEVYVDCCRCVSADGSVSVVGL